MGSAVWEGREGAARGWGWVPEGPRPQAPLHLGSVWCQGRARWPLNKRAASAPDRASWSWSGAHVPPLWLPFQGRAGQRETKGAWPQDTEPVFLPLRGKPHPCNAPWPQSGRLKGPLCSGGYWRRLSPEVASMGVGVGGGTAPRGCPRKETFLPGQDPAGPTRPQGHIHGGKTLWCLASPGSSPGSAP